MSHITVPIPKVFALTNPRAEQDALSLQASFPSVRFVPASRKNWQAAVKDADAVLLNWEIPVDELLDGAPSLKWIQNEGAGVDHLLTGRLRTNDVVVTNTGGVHAVPIAEHVLGLIFAFARQFPDLGRAQAKHQWWRPARGKIFELQGQTLAVIGLGRIGLTLAQKAHGLGLRILGVRRNPKGELPSFVERVYPIDQINDALAQADHVAICLPLTPATHGLFDDTRFSQLRAGSYIYNIGRGGIIDQAALLRALESGRLAGAGLDVTSPEPLPAESPLWADPRIIITNHTSGDSSKNADRILEVVRDNIARSLRGDPLRNVVDKREGY